MIYAVAMSITVDYYMNILHLYNTYVYIVLSYLFVGYCTYMRIYIHVHV